MDHLKSFPRLVDLERFQCVCIYSKASLNRLTMGLTLSGLFTGVVGLGSWNNRLGPKQSDRYRRVVDLRRWSDREVLLNMHHYQPVYCTIIFSHQWLC